MKKAILTTIVIMFVISFIGCEFLEGPGEMGPSPTPEITQGGPTDPPIGIPGTTFYIDPNGNDAGSGSQGSPWKTFTKACSSVTTAGDGIHVNPGIYTIPESCDLAVGVSIEGEGDQSLLISNVTDEWCPTIWLTSPLGTNGNQHISHIKMSGNNATAWSAFYIAGRSNVIVHDCTFVDFFDSAVTFNEKSEMGDQSEPTSWGTGNSFHDNTTDNCSYYRIYDYASGHLQIGSQEGFLVYNNHMTQNSRTGGNNGYVIKFFDFGYNKGLEIYNNTIIKAPTIDNGMDWNFVIEMWHSRGGIEIYNNTLYGSIDFVHARKGDYDYAWSVHDNVIGYDSLQVHNTDATSAGVFIEGEEPGPVYIYNNLIKNVGTPIQFYPTVGNHVNDMYIYNNVFSGIGTSGGNGWSVLIAWSVSNYGNGTGLPTVDNFNFINNTVYAGDVGGASIGLQLPDRGTTTNVNIRNNIFWGFAYDPISGTLEYIEVRNDDGIVLAAGISSIDKLSIENNIFYGNGNDAVRLFGNSPTSYTNANNITNMPIFVTEGSDYHLQTGSPGIGIGLPINWITEDFDGVVVGNPPNIGAFE